MPRKKMKDNPVVKQEVEQKIKKTSPLTEVEIIKDKISKVNLYLSLLDKPLFVTVAVGELHLAREIESEVQEFLLNKAKAMFGENSPNQFKPEELVFLKLLSKKGMETTSSSQEEKKISVPELDKAGSVKVTGVKITKTQDNRKVDTKVLPIVDEQGNKKMVTIETERTVLTPPGVKRLPPPSFEQQLARAHADVANVQKGLGGMVNSPLVVDSSDF